MASLSHHTEEILSSFEKRLINVDISFSNLKKKNEEACRKTVESTMAHIRSSCMSITQIMGKLHQSITTNRPEDDLITDGRLKMCRYYYSEITTRISFLASLSSQAPYLLKTQPHLEENRPGVSNLGQKMGHRVMRGNDNNNI